MATIVTAEYVERNKGMGTSPIEFWFHSNSLPLFRPRFRLDPSLREDLRAHTPDVLRRSLDTALLGFRVELEGGFEIVRCSWISAEAGVGYVVD